MIRRRTRMRRPGMVRRMPRGVARRPVWRRMPIVLLLVAVLGSLIVSSASGARSASAAPGIQKIKHVIMIMQENRSFDSYFGTFPGADGILMKDGHRTVCVPDPLAHRCVRPFHDAHDRNVGGPHGPLNAIRDVDGGKMDGFIREAFPGLIRRCKRPGATNPRCTGGPPADLMGYHDAREIPN